MALSCAVSIFIACANETLRETKRVEMRVQSLQRNDIDEESDVHFDSDWTTVLGLYQISLYGWIWSEWHWNSSREISFGEIPYTVRSRCESTNHPILWFSLHAMMSVFSFLCRQFPKTARRGTIAEIWWSVDRNPKPQNVILTEFRVLSWIDRKFEQITFGGVLYVGYGSKKQSPRSL